MGAMKETMGFQTEVKQLLHLMIHSLYSNKEIFLRELVSNASDACDKLRFEAINNASLFEDNTELKIRVTFDKQARTISIEDNGIGMSDEIVEKGSPKGHFGILGMRESVERGEALTRSASASGLFTPLVLQMMAVGEETGALDDLFVEVADFYEQEVDYDLKQLADAIEPILIVAMGVMVLILALGVFLPMWELASAAKGR